MFILIDDDWQHWFSIVKIYFTILIICRSQWYTNKHFRGTWSVRTLESIRLGGKAGDLAEPITAYGYPVSSYILTSNSCNNPFVNGSHILRVFFFVSFSWWCSLVKQVIRNIIQLFMVRFSQDGAKPTGW